MENKTRKDGAEYFWSEMVTFLCHVIMEEFSVVGFLVTKSCGREG